MNFKKVLKVGAIFTMAFSLVACSGGKDAGKANGANEKNQAEVASEETKQTELGDIAVISREEGSGTRGAFVELTGVLEKVDGKEEDKTTVEAVTQNNTEAVITTVSNDKNAIGYISLGSLKDSVKALKVEGVVASAEDIKNGSYKLARPFNVCYKEGLDEKTSDLLKFIESDEGQKLVEAEGYVPELSGKTYEAIDNDAHITIAGSTSVAPVMEKLVEAYKAKNPNFQADIQATGSGSGIKAAIDGTAALGMSSRELKDDEKSALKVDVIARDGIAIIVNKENALEDIKIETLKSIFTGEVEKWSEI